MNAPRPPGRSMVKVRSMINRLVTRVAIAAAVIMAVMAAAAPPASAHSLDSSTVEVHLHDGIVETTVRVAVETVDNALGTDYLNADITDYGPDLVAYLGDHLSATSADGTEWPETFDTPTIEQVEGITSFSVDVIFDTADSDTTQFTLTYDAIIEQLPTHTAVVVLIDSNDDISTVGVFRDSRSQLLITDGQRSTGIWDMVGYGLNHVLEGADHLLFLFTLLLPAPLVIVAGRWRRGPAGSPTFRPAFRPTFRKVVHVVTAFTIGHSITLIASALGWVAVPGKPVEVLIAVSIAVSAAHAIRPLARHGEEMIAVGFGLVHGLAFAGILSDLGLSGRTSVATLLAFNVGVELAQLLAAALTFPSIYAISRTRYYTMFRVTMASVAGLAAVFWALERVGLMGNPLAFAEAFMIEHPLYVVFGLAGLAIATTALDRRRPNAPVEDVANVDAPAQQTVSN